MDTINDIVATLGYIFIMVGVIYLGTRCSLVLEYLKDNIKDFKQRYKEL